MSHCIFLVPHLHAPLLCQVAVSQEKDKTDRQGGNHPGVSKEEGAVQHHRTAAGSSPLDGGELYLYQKQELGGRK